MHPVKVSTVIAKRIHLTRTKCDLLSASVASSVVQNEFHRRCCNFVVQFWTLSQSRRLVETVMHFRLATRSSNSRRLSAGATSDTGLVNVTCCIPSAARWAVSAPSSKGCPGPSIDDVHLLAENEPWNHWREHKFEDVAPSSKFFCAKLRHAESIAASRIQRAMIVVRTESA
jgi:hypothetical protein